MKGNRLLWNLMEFNGDIPSNSGDGMGVTLHIAMENHHLFIGRLECAIQLVELPDGKSIIIFKHSIVDWL